MMLCFKYLIGFNADTDNIFNYFQMMIQEFHWFHNLKMRSTISMRVLLM